MASAAVSLPFLTVICTWTGPYMVSAAAPVTVFAAGLLLPPVPAPPVLLPAALLLGAEEVPPPAPVPPERRPPVPAPDVPAPPPVLALGVPTAAVEGSRRCAS